MKKIIQNWLCKIKDGFQWKLDDIIFEKPDQSEMEIKPCKPIQMFLKLIKYIYAYNYNELEKQEFF